jgi:hypothetical protein
MFYTGHGWFSLYAGITNRQTIYMNIHTVCILNANPFMSNVKIKRLINSLQIALYLCRTTLQQYR